LVHAPQSKLFVYEELARFIGAIHVVVTIGCTMALKRMDRSTQDEVILPPFDPIAKLSRG
jgi:hypothetical protein